MNQADVLAAINDPVSQRLIDSTIPARIAYVANDGTPRVVPVSYLWDGASFVFVTSPGSPKVAALAANPKVALTIDSEDFPPKVLLVRGTASLEEVEGVPDVYLEANRRKVAPGEFAGWTAGVRRLYKRMTIVTITPEWAKVHDFETRLPSAVEQAVKAAAQS